MVTVDLGVWVEPVGVWVGGTVGRRGVISGGGAVGRRIISGGRLMYICWRGRPTRLLRAVGARVGAGPRP
jgi:hypothetical protein